MEAPRRMAVWNTAFLGDAVLTLPLIRTLRAAWPGTGIDFYVRGGLSPLFEAQPEIDQVYAYDKRGSARGLSGFWRLGREVASRGYDLWINAHLSPRSSLMARLSGAPRRMGYAEASLARWLFTDQVGRRFGERQEVERLLGLLEPLDLPPAVLADEGLHWPELALPVEAQAEADRLLAPLPPGPLLGVHPGSAWPTKRWTPEGFAFVLRRALEAGACVALLASPDERDTAREVLRLAEGMGDGRPLERAAEGPGGTSRLLDLAGKTSLPALAAMLGRLQCYLTNDSGPMHLAWIQRTPVTALFGPTVRSLGFTPRGPASAVLEADEPCRPCGLHGHKTCPLGHFRCMRAIAPEAVWRDVRAKLYPWRTAEPES